MTIKKLLFVVSALVLSLHGFAQDKIFKKNGDIIDAKVLVINTKEITFKKFDNPDGPEYSISKRDVIKIKYLNGTEDIFDGDNERIGIKAGKDVKAGMTRVTDIISIAPIQFTDNGMGIGAAWEHFIDKAGYASIYLPFIATFSGTGSFINSATGIGNNNNTSYNDAMYYFMPGIKVYPAARSSRRAKFSLGPSFFIASGRGINNNDYNSLTAQTDQSHLMLGVMFNVGFNFFSSNKLYVGFDGGLGLTYINQYDGTSAGTTAVAQGAFRVGYIYRSKSKQVRNQK